MSYTPINIVPIPNNTLHMFDDVKLAALYLVTEAYGLGTYSYDNGSTNFSCEYGYYAPTYFASRRLRRPRLECIAVTDVATTL